MQIHTIGIDLGKTVFHLVGLNLRGEVVVRRKCSRTHLPELISWEEHSGNKGMRCGLSRLST